MAELKNSGGALVLEYAPPKHGKTVDLIYSFPTATFLALPGALKPSVGVVGYQPREVRTEDLYQVYKVLERLPDGSEAVIDDLSLVVMAHAKVLEAKGMTGWDLWGALLANMLNVLALARKKGLILAMNAHQQEPKVIKETGMKLKGGPQLPGQLVEKVPASVDTVLQVRHEPEVQGWSGRFFNELNPTYVVGDRHGIAYTGCPQNMAEVLRAYGFHIKCHPDYPWMEDVTAALADALEAQPAATWGRIRQQFVTEVRAQFSSHKGSDPLALRWLLRDGTHRAIIRLARKTNPLKEFGVV